LQKRRHEAIQGSRARDRKERLWKEYRGKGTNESRAIRWTARRRSLFYELKEPFRLHL